MSASSYRVLKFGGSSLGQPERLAWVLRRIEEERQSGPLAVVVSAFGDTTDWLLAATQAAARGELDAALGLLDRVATLATETARTVAGEQGLPPSLARHVTGLVAAVRDVVHGMALTRESTPQARDRVLAVGELLSATLVSGLLELRQVPVTFVDARQWVRTDASFGSAQVDVVASRDRIAELSKGWGERIAVVPGFIGQTADGRITTLGRNGSDYTAALLARGLRAREVVVWTDVDGLYTADPSLVDDAYPVRHLTHQEALELATVGARMFHPRTMIPLIEGGIPLRIRNTLAPEQPGTLIDAAGSPDAHRPTCIGSLEELALLGVEVRRLSQQVLLGERAVGALRGADVTVWMITQSAHGQSLAVVVPAAQAEQAEEALRTELAPELAHGEVEPPRVRRPVTLVTLVAEAMGHSPNVAGRFFGALGQAGINVHAVAQGASARSISCVVDGADTASAVRLTHAAFNLAHQQVSLLVLGKGTVGSQLLAQVFAQQQWLARQHGIALRVVGVADSHRALFDERGLAQEGLLERLEQQPASPRGTPVLRPLLERLRVLPVPVLVDCTAADGMEAHYLDAFSHGIHVVAANKKPLALPWAKREQLLATARRHHRAYHYETTVGASLPVIDTLIALVRTGDTVRRVEGALSGTLGFLSDALMKGQPLSAAVREARERGYTEPHPREDLSGADVCRKALILARELGLALDLEDVEVEPFVPARLLAEDSPEAFLSSLERIDAEVESRVSALRNQGKVLRYLARVDPDARAAGRPVIQVGPVAVDREHPAAQLRGAEALVAFTTDRHREYPLLVRGAGAGGAVTASGVLADILRVAQALRGR
jgi:aspartokinase/homoserine dehydrogenase 1